GGRVRRAVRPLRRERSPAVPPPGRPPVPGPDLRQRAHHLHPSGGNPVPRAIEVTVSPQGEATVQTRGYAGSDCLRASKFLEQALGVVADDRKTGEFY